MPMASGALRRRGEFLAGGDGFKRGFGEGGAGFVGVGEYEVSIPSFGSDPLD